MKDRRAEKISWTAGWGAGFIWVAILSVVLIYQQRFGEGLLGIVVILAAMIAVRSLAPWRHPLTAYWKLMLAPYGLFLLAIAWAVWSYGSLESLGFNWWNLLWLLPALSPFGFLSNRKWAESDGQSTSAPPAVGSSGR